jgi:DNA repair protein RecO (recombination protein O)
MLRRLEGIVLKERDYSETHKIITIFTKEQGKITAISKGANKPKSRLSAISQPFIKADFLIFLTKGLSTIQQGEMMDSFRHIREDIIKTAYAAYLVELTEKIMESNQRDPYLYQQLSSTFTWINENGAYMIPVIMYELKMYQKGGFAPVVDRCVNCGRNELPYTFSIREGGFLCPHCTSIDHYTIQIPPAFSKLLSLFIAVPIENIGNITIKKENELLLRKLLDAYYDQYGGFSLKSKRFLAQIDRLS